MLGLSIKRRIPGILLMRKFPPLVLLVLFLAVSATTSSWALDRKTPRPLGGNRNISPSIFLKPGLTTAQKLYEVAMHTGLPFFSGVFPEEIEITEERSGIPLKNFFPGWRFFYHELVFSRNSYIFVAIPDDSANAYVLGFRNSSLPGFTGYPSVEQIDLMWRDFLRFETGEMLSQRQSLALASLYVMARAHRGLPKILYKPQDLPLNAQGIAAMQDKDMQVSPPHMTFTDNNMSQIKLFCLEQPGNLLTRWTVEFKLEQYEGYINGFLEKAIALIDWRVR